MQTYGILLIDKIVCKKEHQQGGISVIVTNRKDCESILELHSFLPLTNFYHFIHLTVTTLKLKVTLSSQICINKMNKKFY